MKYLNGWQRLLVCIFFLFPSLAWGAFEQDLPVGTSLFLSIKDFPHLEEQLSQSGVLSLPAEYRDYLADYLAQKYGFFKLYKTFRNLDAQHVLKTLITDVAVVEMEDQTTLLILTINPQYALIPQVLEKLQSVDYLQKFFTNALGQRYFTWFVNNTIVVSGEESALEKYQSAPKIQPDEGLLHQVLGTGNVVLYSRSPSFLHPFLVKLLFGENESREFALSVDLGTKSCTVYTPPSATTAQSEKRILDFGWYIPEQAIAFIDSAKNPGNFLQRFFGSEMLSEYLPAFQESFTNQASLALLDIADNLEPSFVWVTQAKGGRHANTAPTLTRFLADVVGEDFEVVKPEESAALPVKRGETSGLFYYTLGGFHIITDSDAQIADALQILTGRSPSVWDKQALTAIEGLAEKPAVFFVDCKKLAERLTSSTVWDKILDPTYFQKDEVAAYLDALKNLGLLVGYREQTPQFDRYHLALK